MWFLKKYQNEKKGSSDAKAQWLICLFCRHSCNSDTGCLLRDRASWGGTFWGRPCSLIWANIRRAACPLASAFLFPMPVQVWPVWGNLTCHENGGQVSSPGTYSGIATQGYTNIPLSRNFCFGYPTLVLGTNERLKIDNDRLLHNELQIIRLKKATNVNNDYIIQ